MAEIGLRYRPNDRADLEAHAAKLALLAIDLSDIPEKQLRIAIDRWTATSPYLPKASDLIEIARKSLQATAPSAPAERVAALRSAIPEWNRKLYLERKDLIGLAEWRVTDHGEAYIHDLTPAEIRDRRW